MPNLTNQTRQEALKDRLLRQQADPVHLPPPLCHRGMKLEFFYDKRGVSSIKVSVIEQGQAPIIRITCMRMNELLTNGITIHEPPKNFT